MTLFFSFIVKTIYIVRGLNGGNAVIGDFQRTRLAPPNPHIARQQGRCRKRHPRPMSSADIIAVRVGDEQNPAEPSNILGAKQKLCRSVSAVWACGP